MLGRTRPASRILLWPRRNPTAARFTTSRSTGSSHEATAETDAEEVGNDVQSQPHRRTPRRIRRISWEAWDPTALRTGKYTIRRVTGNTAPVIFGDQRQDSERELGNAKASDSTVEDAGATGRVVSNDAWSKFEEEFSNAGVNKDEPGTKKAVSRVVAWRGRKHSPQVERASQRLSNVGAFPGNWGRVANVEASTSPLGQWKPFSPNPDLVAVKAPLPGEVPFQAQVPTATPPAISSLPDKSVQEAEVDDDGTPSRSKVLDELRAAWSYNPRPARRKRRRTIGSEPPSEESNAVPEDDGPPRSKIIEEMRAWSYVPEDAAPSVEEQGAGKQNVPENETASGPPAGGATKRREKVLEELPPLDSEFRKWLKTATTSAMSEANANKADTAGIEVYNGPTVLVLNAASRSLLESDFYRLADQGKHLDNWAVGIARVVQARDPSTYEPLGKYHIFFHTRAAALAYMEEARQLHLHSRRAAQLVSKSLSSSSDISIPGPLPLAPALTAESADLDAAAKAYTLLPHSAVLDLKLHLCKDLMPFPPPDKLSLLDQRLSCNDETRGMTSNNHFVLVSLEGSKTTCAALQAAIVRDGDERRVPWGLASHPDGVSPIAAILPGDDESGFALVDDGTFGYGTRRFWRFVVPFVDAAEARRFVRNWHRREMRDLEGRNMVATLNVTALW